jgi:hypothetical protein
MSEDEYEAEGWKIAMAICTAWDTENYGLAAPFVCEALSDVELARTTLCALGAIVRCMISLLAMEAANPTDPLKVLGETHAKFYGY